MFYKESKYTSNDEQASQSFVSDFHGRSRFQHIYIVLSNSVMQWAQ